MASAAYQALTYQRAPEWVLLLNLTAREALHCWTQDGTAYWVALSAYTHPSTLPKAGGGTWLSRGLYREITGVSEGTTALTVKTNKADVQANAGSCWFDEASEKLYVRTTGSVNPDTLAVIYADFTLRFASKPVNPSGSLPYRGLLDGQILPSIEDERADLLLSSQVSTRGDVSLVNGDGLFDYLAEKYVWEQGTATFKLGGEGFAIGDYETIAVRQVDRPMTAGDRRAVLQLSSRQSILTSIVQRTWLNSNYSGPVTPGYEHIYSYYMPLFWGRVFNVPLTAYSAGAFGYTKFFACDAFMQRPTVVAVYAVRKDTRVRTALTEFVDYQSSTFAPNEWEIDILTSTWSMDDYTFTADLDWRSSPTMTYPQAGGIMQDLLELAGVTSDLVDTASFAAADAINGAILGFYIPGGPSSDIAGRMTLADAFDVLTRSTLTHAQVDVTGKWRADAWDPSFDLSTVTTLHEPDIDDWTPVETVQAHPVARVQVFYLKETGLGEDGADRYAGSEQSSSTEAAARLKKAETTNVETVLVEASAAAQLAARLRLISERHPKQWRFSTGLKLMNARKGDKVRVIRPRGESLTGTFDRVLEIIKITKELTTMRVTVVVSNMSGLDEKVKVVAPAGGADWASSSTDDRRQYAFVCDPTTGCVDPSDPSTFEQAVIW